MSLANNSLIVCSSVLVQHGNDFVHIQATTLCIIVIAAMWGFVSAALLVQCKAVTNIGLHIQAPYKTSHM